MNNSAKRIIELLLPGVLTGVFAAFVIGGIALLGGLPTGYIVVSTLSLGVPLALFGAGYEILLAQARIRLGGVTPTVGYWVVGYMVSRIVNEAAVNAYLGEPLTAVSGGIPAFILFQFLVSTGFAIGFIWLHENTATLWWMHIRDRNPIANAYVKAYMQEAAYSEQKKQEQKARSEKKKISLKALRKKG